MRTFRSVKNNDQFFNFVNDEKVMYNYNNFGFLLHSCLTIPSRYFPDQSLWDFSPFNNSVLIYFAVIKRFNQTPRVVRLICLVSVFVYQ